MTKVKREYYLPGSRYSQNKVTIKNIFKKYGLKWKGTMEFPRWTSGDNTIIAEFIRENEVTVGAKLKFEGDPLGEFCIEFTKVMGGLGAEYDDIEVISQDEINKDIEREIEEQMKVWDRVHRPNVEILRKGSIHNGFKPVPEGFINAAINDYKMKREKEVERLRAELSRPAKVMEDDDITITKEELKEPVKKYPKAKKKSGLDFDITLSSLKSKDKK